MLYCEHYTTDKSIQMMITPTFALFEFGVLYLGLVCFIWVWCALFGFGVPYLGLMCFIWVCCALFGFGVLNLSLVCFI